MARPAVKDAVAAVALLAADHRYPPPTAVVAASIAVR
jgi:hypothetical protein